MARKTREEALKTRMALLDAAEHVFYERGYAKSSLEDVALEAGVSRGAIYWHFKNKTDLFMAMVERVRLPIESLAESASCEGDDPLAKLRTLALNLLRETATNPRRRRVLTIVFQRCELVGEVAELEMRQRSAFVDCMGRIEALLASAVEANQLPSRLNIKRAAFAWHGFLMGIIGNWLFFPEALDLDKEAESLVDGGMVMLLGLEGRECALPR